MKVFTAVLAAALAMLIPLSAQPRAASASTDGRQYARAETRNVYFCADMDDSTALFALPYTYFVEIIADHGEWYLVRYAKDDGVYRAVTGYCRKSGLAAVEEPTGELYLNYPVTAVLRSPVPQDGSMPGLEIEVTAAYYGVYYRGAAAYSYVLYDGAFKYIEGSHEDYPLNEIPAEPTFGEQPEDGETPDDNSRLITAIVVCVLAAAVVVALVFTGRARKPRIDGYNKQ